MVTHVNFPIADDTTKLLGSVGRTLNYLHRTRTGLVKKPPEEMGPLDVMCEAVREDNPRGFNRKVMKHLRKGFWHFRKTETKMRRIRERIQATGSTP